MTLLTACRIQLLDVSLTPHEYADPLVIQIMLMNFNLIFRNSQIGHRETTWHYMKISLSTYAILPTDVILSTSFPLITNIFNTQHQLTPFSLLLISSVIWAFQFPVIYPGSSCDKARTMAVWVFSVFHTRNTGVMLTLYKSLVRSHLE